MKIILVALNSQYIHNNLAIRYLKEYTRDLIYECILKEFTINEKLESVLEEIIKDNADVIAFSCYIWNVEYVKKLSEIIHVIAPNIKILYGGPEVSYDSESFIMDNEGDYLIVGEGEETYRELIKALINQCDTLNIPGLYTRVKHKLYWGGERELMDLSKIPFPYNNTLMENKIIYYEASRGCPYNCSYCLSSTIHSVRFLHIDRVKRDIEKLIRLQPRIIKFVDRTFNCNAKFASEIFDFVIKLDTTVIFHFEISGDLITEEQLQLLKHCPTERIQFEVGIQSTNEKTLEAIDRRVPTSVLFEKIKRINELKVIKQHVDLIAGLPYEDLQSFENSFNEVYKLGVPEIQLGFLKVLKGSKMKREESKWALKYLPFPPYEILENKYISYAQLTYLKKIEYLVDKYYNSGKFSICIKYLEKNFIEPFDFYKNLCQYFEKNEYYKRSLGFIDHYRTLSDFYEANEDNKQFFKELLKYEFLLHNKKQWVPDFLPRYRDKGIERKIEENIRYEHSEVEVKEIHVELFKFDIKAYFELEAIVPEICAVVYKGNSVLKIINNL